MLPDEQSKRFIAILNKKIETGKLINAFGHCLVGLTSKVTSEEMGTIPYADKEGNPHGPVSNFPVIILKAENSNEIRKVRAECVARNIPYTDCTESMTIGTTEEQLVATRTSLENELEYCAILMFGLTDELRLFTKKFSLFK